MNILNKQQMNKISKFLFPLSNDDEGLKISFRFGVLSPIIWKIVKIFGEE